MGSLRTACALVVTSIGVDRGLSVALAPDALLPASLTAPTVILYVVFGCRATTLVDNDVVVKAMPTARKKKKKKT